MNQSSLIQQNLKVEEFCSQIQCINVGHEQHPIEYFCMSPECNQSTKLMCDKCINMHHFHCYKPVKMFNDLSIDDLQADQHINSNIEQILIKLKSFRVEVLRELDQMEQSIQGMKSVSLKSIIDDIMKQEINLDNCGLLQKVMQDNVIWNQGGIMQVKRKVWSQISSDILQISQKVINQFQRGIEIVAKGEKEQEKKSLFGFLQKQRPQKGIEENVEIISDKPKGIEENVEINLSNSRLDITNVQQLIEELNSAQIKETTNTLKLDLR